MAGSFLKEDGDISEINVVPLVDIILVVLIIFMVTAPMFMKPTINVNLPKAAHGDQTPPSPFNISLTKDGRINLNGQFVEIEVLRLRSEEEFKKNAEAQAIISADKDVSHGQVVAILDIVKGAGIKKFAISIDQQK